MRRRSGLRVDELPPLPDPSAGDGYDWIDNLTGGWAAVPAWGRGGGWNLGRWPLVILAICRTSTGTGPLWGVCVYVEGDVYVSAHLSRDEMIQTMDHLAEFYWRHMQTAPDDLPPGSGLLDHHRGPYEA